MEVVEHCIGSHLENDGSKRIRLDINDKEDEQLSECESESSEVLSVGSEPTPTADNIISESKDCKTSEYVDNNLESSRLEYQQTEVNNKPANSNCNSNSNSSSSNIILSSSSSSSRTPSPSPSNGSSCNLPQSPHSYCSTQQQPLSPTASLSIRSSASSNTTALSPSRSTTDVTQEAIIFKYQSTTSALNHQQQQLLSRYSIGESSSELRGEYTSPISRMPPHSIVQELSYSSAASIEKLHSHRIASTTAGSSIPAIPLMTQISLSPPLATATTATSGLQITTPTPVFHPSCRNNPRSDSSLILHPVHLHVNSSAHSLLHHHSHYPTQGQHLSVTNILQSNIHQHHKENQQVIQSRSLFNSNSNKLTRSSPIREQNKSPVLNRDNQESNVNNNSPNNIYHRHNNISNDNDMQASLKFSIDNILKADFGRRITDPISLKKSRTKKHNQTPIDLTKDFVESSSDNNSSERGADLTTNSSSMKTPLNTPITNANTSPGATSGTDTKQMLWPAWVYCTRYSDRPSSGRSPRTRRVKRSSESRSSSSGNAAASQEEKRPRTAFSGEQLARLKREFAENRYLTERRRQQLSRDLGLNEAQIKIWFQNKRAKIKKASGQKNPLALQLMAQGLYNHSTVPLTKEEEDQAAELEGK